MYVIVPLLCISKLIFKSNLLVCAHIGEGPILHVYNVDSQKETSSAKVLPHASIHGLKSGK